MGFDKQLLQIREQRLICALLPKLRQCFDDILIVTNRAELYEGMAVRVTQDIIPGKGPMSGIHAGLKAATSEYVYVMACDMPRFDPTYARELQQRITTHPKNIDACVTQKGDWIEPFHAFYGQGALSMLEEDLLADKTSVFYLLKKLSVLYVPEQEARTFTPDWSLFCNLNTREEYLAYLKQIGG